MRPYGRAITPRTAPAIMRLSAAIDKPVQAIELLPDCRNHTTMQMRIMPEV